MYKSANSGHKFYSVENHLWKTIS
uniref:Uncharacterized protein n=1 Tax=Arundo donax TaxID=35708 RepID=A0A0A8YRD6_ARUDO